MAEGTGHAGARSPRKSTGEIASFFAILAGTELAAGLLVLGVYFFTAQRFGWGLSENFQLATVQGVLYVAGALIVSKLAGRFGRRTVLMAILLLAGLAATAGLLGSSVVLIVAMLLAYNMLLAMCWPVLESLMCSGLSAHALSKRIGNFNLVWSGVCTVAVAGNGWIIDHWPAGVFVLPMAIHFASTAVLAVTLKRDRRDAAVEASPHLAPEPELKRMRTLAMWLSRIALPATYLMIYSLLAMMPSLPVFSGRTVTEQTLYGSAWMAARWAAFWALGVTTWWHTRPRVLLLATAVALAAFLGITLSGSLAGMIASQLVFGAAVGLIYCASLYFGMVLSDGSTEHGGYHEALIGLGMTLGPGVGAVMQLLHVEDFRASVYAVAALGMLTLLAAIVAERIATHRRAAGVKKNSPRGPREGAKIPD